LPNSVEKVVGFSRGFRKDSLTGLEKAYNSGLKEVFSVLTFDFEPRQPIAVGMLQVEVDGIGVDKLIILQDAAPAFDLTAQAPLLSSDNDSLLAPFTISQSFHQPSLLIDGQREIITYTGQNALGQGSEGIRLNYEQIAHLRTDNRLIDNSGAVVIVEAVRMLANGLFVLERVRKPKQYIQASDVNLIVSDVV
jgi:hypothetical protein